MKNYNFVDNKKDKKKSNKKTVETRKKPTKKNSAQLVAAPCFFILPWRIRHRDWYPMSLWLWSGSGSAPQESSNH